MSRFSYSARFIPDPQADVLESNEIDIGIAVFHYHFERNAEINIYRKSY